MRGYGNSNGNGNDPTDRYLTDRVATASPAELIGMLFDAGVKALHAALDPALDPRRDLATYSRHLMRAQDAVMELRCSLNRDAGDNAASEMVTNLDAIYSYLYGKLVDANVKRDRALAKQCLTVLQPLQEAWRDACLTKIAVAAS